MVGITNDTDDIDPEYLKGINPRKDEEEEAVRENIIRNFSKESPEGSVSQGNDSQENDGQRNIRQGNINPIMKVLRKAVNR